MGFLTRLVVVCFVAWICYQTTLILKHMIRLGFTSHTVNHSPGPCHVFNVDGAEDIDLISDDLAIFTSGLRYNVGGHSDPRMLARHGRVYIFDFKNPHQAPKELTLKNFDNSSFNFNPVGLDVYIDSDKTLVFVVNRGSKTGIEIFQFDQENLVLDHVKTILDENIYHPNDVVAVGPEQFYVTNDLYFSNPILKKIEVYYPFALGNVVFYNGNTSMIVAGNIKFANGIDIDKVGKYVYVASVFDNCVFAYQRNSDNSLGKPQEIFFGSMIDNINIDPDTGYLYVAGVTQAMAYEKHNNNLSKPCPSKVLMAKLSEGKQSNVPHEIDDIQEIYSSTGEGNLKCASTALFHKGKLLIGTIFHNFMYCEVLTV